MITPSAPCSGTLSFAVMVNEVFFTVGAVPSGMRTLPWARVGEHSAVVLNSLYFRPFAASASKVGVGTGPPNTLEAPKPTSSVKISSTLGAPAGADTGCGKSGFESSVVRPIKSFELRIGVGQHGDIRRSGAHALGRCDLGFGGRGL